MNSLQKIAAHFFRARGAQNLTFELKTREMVVLV